MKFELKSITLGVVVVFILFPNCNFAVSSTPNRKAKVLILGAGMTGISFAKTLHDNNESDFVVLEGKHRIGGRVTDSVLNGTTIELGAGWIHHIGEKNPVWKLKHKYGLQSSEDDYENFIVRNETGGQYQNATNVYKRLQQAIGKVDEFLNKRAKLKLWDLPVRTGLQMNGWNPSTPTEWVMDFYANDFENGIPPEMASINNAGFTFSKTWKDHVVTDSRGYSYIIHRLAADFVNKIHLNTTVTKIEYSDKIVTVETSIGEKYTGDYAFITFSTGVLLSGSVQFAPALPEWKLNAARLLPMGQYTKIFLKFPRKFWDNNNYLLVASENRGYYVQWQNVHNYVNQSILLVTVTGFESIRIEKLTDKQVTDEAMGTLKKVYGNSIPQPSEMKMSRWSRDPFAFGAYCAPVVGADSFAYTDLKTPVGKTLWFGGDGAMNAENFGYLQDAYRSGLYRAYAFLKCLKQNICPTYEPRKAAKINGAIRKTFSDLKTLCFFSFIAVLTNVIKFK